MRLFDVNNNNNNKGENKNEFYFSVSSIFLLPQAMPVAKYVYIFLKVLFFSAASALVAKYVFHSFSPYTCVNKGKKTLKIPFCFTFFS